MTNPIHLQKYVLRLRGGGNMQFVRKLGKGELQNVGIRKATLFETPGKALSFARLFPEEAMTVMQITIEVKER